MELEYTCTYCTVVTGLIAAIIIQVSDTTRVFKSRIPAYKKILANNEIHIGMRYCVFTTVAFYSLLCMQNMLFSCFPVQSSFCRMDNSQVDDIHVVLEGGGNVLQNSGGQVSH